MAVHGDIWYFHWLLSALTEDPDSVSSTHMAAHNVCDFSSRGSNASSDLCGLLSSQQLGRQRELCEFEASLVYRVSGQSYTVRPCLG